MSRSMQNLLREFRTLYEERLQRLDLAQGTPETMKAKHDVYQHYVHDLLEQNDALIMALKDSENKLETSGQLETSLMEEVNLAKGFEEELQKTKDSKIRLEEELRTVEDQSNRLREQLDESDLARERLEATISESHHDLARARMEMNDLRDKIRKFESNSEGIDQQVIRLKVQLEEEQGECERLSNMNNQLQSSLDRTKSELNASHLNGRKLESEIAEKDIEIENLEKDLIATKLGQDSIQTRESHDKQQKIVLTAKVSELEKELRPLRLENDATTEKLTRERELSMELASTVSRLKDQVQIQMENFSKIESVNKEMKRKNKESQDEIQSLDRRRATLINETQKLRELLNEAQADRQSLKDNSRQLEIDHQKAIGEVKTENRNMEMKLERRAQEIDDLVGKITKLNNNIGSLKSSTSSAKDENRDLENRLVELKREITSLSSTSEDQKDQLAQLANTLHQRDVEIDGLRSSFTNKAAESEELMSQLSKQEQLVHELTTELNTKNSELKRLTLTHEDIIREMDENIELARCQKVKLESQDEVIGSLKAEVDEYEKMKPHPEVEVVALRSKIDFLNLEKESLCVKKAELERRSADLSSLCNELRNKLKSAISNRDQTSQSVTLYETKLHQAEMRIKEMDTLIENIKHQNTQKTEKLQSKIDILHSRVAETENFKRNSDELCHSAQSHSQELRVEADRLKHELNEKSDVIAKLERDSQLGSNELEQMSERIKDKHIQNCKLEKLVEELTSNCENLQRHKRESESLLKALRGELGMANKARKVTEKQIENYRNTVRQLEDTASARTMQHERLNEQLSQQESTEHHLRNKKKELKASLAEQNDLNSQLNKENSELKRDNSDLTRRSKSLEEALKSLRREVDVIRQKTRREAEHVKKNHEISDAEFTRKNNEIEAKNLRLQGECMRLGDVIEKTQSELNTSKIQLSQIQRTEVQLRQELESVRSLTNTKDKRGKELQVEIDRLQHDLSRATTDLHRQMREKETLMSEEEKLRKYSMKQQTLIQELRRKLAMFNTDLKSDFKKVAYQPHQMGGYGDFAATQ